MFAGLHDVLEQVITYSFTRR